MEKCAATQNENNIENVAANDVTKNDVAAASENRFNTDSKFWSRSTKSNNGETNENFGDVQIAGDAGSTFDEVVSTFDENNKTNNEKNNI